MLAMTKTTEGCIGFVGSPSSCKPRYSGFRADYLRFAIFFIHQIKLKLQSRAQKKILVKTGEHRLGTAGLTSCEMRLKGQLYTEMFLIKFRSQFAYL